MMFKWQHPKQRFALHSVFYMTKSTTPKNDDLRVKISTVSKMHKYSTVSYRKNIRKKANWGFMHKTAQTQDLFIF